MTARAQAEPGVRAALYYGSDAHDASRERLMGMQVANAGFLSAVLAHAAPGPVSIHTSDAEAFAEFRRRFPSPRETRLIPFHDVSSLAGPGCLMLPGPALARHARLRRYAGGAFALCGVTHAMASERTLDAVRDLVAAPVEPWDAVICTSRAVRDVVAGALDEAADALAERTGARPTARPLLPLIPLGVDAGALVAAARDSNRAALRARLAIGADDFVVLYLGRLSHHSKAHPVPLYRTLDRLGRHTRRRVVLIEAGWFHSDAMRTAYAEAAATIAPGLAIVAVDARQPEGKTAALAAADVFVSFADNIQESFGLTPLEAMAAGLPAVVSDWDGYRDTVVDGETGYLIPTLVPPAGAGLDLAWRSLCGVDDYDTHIALVAQYTAVDTDAAIAALARLASDPALCRRLGDGGRRRVLAHFDWPVIVRACEALWAEMAERRRPVAGSGPAGPARNMRLAADPYCRFAGFATASIAGQRFVPADDAEAMLGRVAGLALGPLDPRVRAHAAELLTQMTRHGALAIGPDIAPDVAQAQHLTLKTLAWCLKMGIIRRADAGSTP